MSKQIEPFDILVTRGLGLHLEFAVGDQGTHRGVPAKNTAPCQTHRAAPSLLSVVKLNSGRVLIHILRSKLLY